MNKEQVYDEKIHSLMDQIISICKEHGIAMIASFSIPTDENDQLCCTTCTEDENGKNGSGHLAALRAVGAPL